MTTFTLRLATRADGPTIAAIFGRARRAKLPFLPILHTPEEDIAFFSGHVMDTCTVWMAETTRPVAFVAWRDGEVDHLYVEPDLLGRGIGSALLAKAMEGQSSLELWAFQKNVDALAFYRAKGFRVIRETDGRDNEEKEPDVRLRWERG